LKFCDNDERPTGKKNTTIKWDNGEKGNSNLILNKIGIVTQILYSDYGYAY
jgi:hypothetical protein